jgi:spore coat polysaccharide biosynthesis predicted glycosyltransferase SpsG/CTP:molybdopterin cytidylyltransferase MocA
MSLIALVPARRGSVGVKGKNTAIVDGKPLVAHVLSTLASMGEVDRVVVSTDDPNVAAIGVLYGAEILDRPENLADGASTIDDVVEWFRVENGYENSYLVVQPTVPEVTAAMLRDLMSKETNGAWALAVPSPHLHYQDGKPLWTSRENRQDSTSGITREVGVRWYPPDSDGISHAHPITADLMDVDTLGDLAELRARADEWTVVFRCKVGPDIGHGHLTRCLAIAEQLQHHDVYFDVTGDHETLPWPEATLVRTMSDDSRRIIIVNDTLDTTVDEMLELKSFGPVVTLEDLGPGAVHSDDTINALYADGPRYAVLRPEFINPPPVERGDHILITFGGTDPAMLSERCEQLGKVIKPPGRPDAPGETTASMAHELASARVVVTSCGRTLYEAAAVGTPAIAIAQNTRETTHGHLGMEYGNIYLGHHALVTPEAMRLALESLLADNTVWSQLSAAARKQVDGKGVFRVARRVEDVMLEWA